MTATKDLKLLDNIRADANLASNEFDAVIMLLYPLDKKVTVPKTLEKFVAKIMELDRSACCIPTLWSCDFVAGGRLILAPTGKLTPYHDCDSVYNAMKRGMQRAVDAGVSSPLLVIPYCADFPNGQLVAALGALESLYIPFEMRELKGKYGNVTWLGVYAEKNEQEKLKNIIKSAFMYEKCRIVTRDIGTGDPERMSPKNIVEYVRNQFRGESCITITEISDESTLKKEYPLFDHVSRAASTVERHKSRILQIEYNPPDASKITETVMLVGKGVTYDTGGADIKISLAMAGMSRDKFGAAVVAGFLKACSLFKPPHLKAIGVLCLCRNSIGEESYVADELLVSRSGKSVRVTNTDAEGRLVMADALYHMAERAGNEKNPHIYTIATLTNHARISHGRYAAAMDNHTARAEGYASKLQNCASKMAEGIEVSYIRSVDLDLNNGQIKGDDLVQINMTALRLHQLAAGFLIIISGLDQKNVKYTHLDITGVALYPDQPTGAPLLALCNAHNVLSPSPL